VDSKYQILKENGSDLTPGSVLKYLPAFKVGKILQKKIHREQGTKEF
jgi:hypothetical protein